MADRSDEEKIAEWLANHNVTKGPTKGTCIRTKKYVEKPAIARDETYIRALTENEAVRRALVGSLDLVVPKDNFKKGAVVSEEDKATDTSYWKQISQLTPHEREIRRLRSVYRILNDKRRTFVGYRSERLCMSLR